MHGFRILAGAQVGVSLCWSAADCTAFLVASAPCSEPVSWSCLSFLTLSMVFRQFVSMPKLEIRNFLPFTRTSYSRSPRKCSLQFRCGWDAPFWKWHWRCHSHFGETAFHLQQCLQESDGLLTCCSTEDFQVSSERVACSRSPQNVT